MKKDVKLGVNLMSKSVIEEMIRGVTDLEVQIAVTVIEDLGKICQKFFISYK